MNTKDLRLDMIEPSLNKVHILIPTFNRSSQIVRCLRSVVAQTYTNWKITIVDNCSSDDTVERVRGEFYELIQLKKLNILEFDETVPIIENWNRCVEAIDNECEYLKFLWSDDYLNTQFLSLMVNKLVSNPDLKAVGCAIEYVNRRGENLGKRRYGSSKVDFLKSAFYKNSLGCPSSMLLKANDFASRKFNHENRYVADLEHIMDVLSSTSYETLCETLTYVEVSNSTETSLLSGSEVMVKNKIDFMETAVQRYYRNSLHYRILKLFMAASLRVYFFTGSLTNTSFKKR